MRSELYKVITRLCETIIVKLNKIFRMVYVTTNTPEIVITATNMNNIPMNTIQYAMRDAVCTKYLILAPYLFVSMKYHMTNAVPRNIWYRCINYKM